MNESQLHPVTFNFSTLKGYQLNSLVEFAKNPNLPFFDTELERSFFVTVANEVYIPLLKILDSTETGSTIIITGHFLDMCDKYSPVLLNLIRDMVNRNQLHIVANAYFGNSLTSLYHSHWWAQSIESTYHKVKDLLKTEIKGIFIEQLFRGLELERVTHLSTVFLSRHNKIKYNYLEIQLSDLRKFDGTTVSWINKDNDKKCCVNFVPNSLYFDINSIFFSLNLKFGAKAIALKAGSVNSRLRIRRNTPWHPLPFVMSPRINEKYSLVLYTPIERAVIRLWEYGAYNIASVYDNQQDQQSEILFKNFSRLQDAEYLRFLKKQTYKNPELLLFTSPFEAFVHMQTMIKLLEVTLQSR